MIKQALWIGLLALGQQAAWSFSLLGPDNAYPGKPTVFGDAWQVPLIGYNPLAEGAAPPFLIDGLLTGPKNLGEEYRRNTPVMYYAADANFLDYFGSNGAVALDGAFAILNNVFTNVPAVVTNGLDAYSAGLSEFSLNSIEMNYQAQGLDLVDLKSETLSLMTEQLGLADAVRYTWALHDRNNTGAPCPAEYYLVIQRNFDFTATPLNQIQYSFYVNGELYTYAIFENCGAPGASPPDADALDFATDPLFDNPPVASGIGEDYLLAGEFYSGLTRDDVAGLRYLLSTNNINMESPATNTLFQNTNFTSPQLLFTTNLGALLSSAQTNAPATLAGLFPGVVVTSSSNYFTIATNPVIVSYFTNSYGSPAGSPPVLVLYTNGFTYSPVERYVTTFGNVVITTNYFANSYRTNTPARIVTVTVGVPSGAPAGSPLVTNTTVQNVVLTNVPSGDYYLIPPGSCGFDFLNPQPPHYPIEVVSATTNLIIQATNSAGFFYSQSLVIFATNHIFVVYPCTLTVPTPALYQGIGKMQFVRANFDSLLGQFFQPITNTYTMVSVTNSQPVLLTFQRVVTAPDFLFSAQDLGATAGFPLPVAFTRNINFDMGNIYPGLAGPGVINAPSTITFTKIGPTYDNLGPSFLNGPFGYLPTRNFLWGSFDGTTNDPVVYPNGASIANLAAEVLIQIFPASLPNGTNGVTYPTVMLSATGGQTPYAWALASGSALPPGLNLSSDGVVSGTPTQSGQYVVTIQMTDAANRTVAVNYSVTIN